MILNRTRHLFICRTTLTEESNEQDVQRIKTILRKTQKEHETRNWLGTSCDLWADYTECFEEIVVQLQEQYQFPDVTASSDRNFTTLVLMHSGPLLKDFERLNDLLLLARNLLASSHVAQDNAVLEDFHQQVYQLMQICVEFNIQGFDGEAGSASESIFTKVINSSKVLLATCLQFIHNLVTKNEVLKMRLWLDLLCENTDVFVSEAGVEEEEELLDSITSKAQEGYATELSSAPVSDADVEVAVKRLLGPFANSNSADGLRYALVNWTANGIELTLSKMHRIELVPPASSEEDQAQTSNDIYAEPQLSPPRYLERLSIPKALGRITAAKSALVHPLDAEFPVLIDGEDPDAERDIELDPDAPPFPTGEDAAYQKEVPTSPYTLSEIPIILAPNEIEALPLMLQSCVLSSNDLMSLTEQQRIEQAVRCHLLLKMSTGRMLLRELYIFIAAWDLPEDEIFFKAMVNITNSFLQYSLLPTAYEALADPKDIVSPAQAVLVKLILHIFKTEIDPPERYRSRSSIHQAHDLDLIRFLLSTFRTNILPRSLAIIWMQGMVRDQVATPEEFEKANLNLWDMERTYEGVYQFLELFSALNDNPVWKAECIKSEVALS
ncbi:MAG: hypothetical protein LQ340_007220 [Diploschistes diacapsis]|nr:MAG: hypothetical protein LQ340_007220 [Diploschistes diacapsis]